ncbi:MAG: hypothetical protein O3B22_12575 [Proteobacteria bacterium]|jgi:hypothetical protein|nr:hypothetical protein [Pseudomonadota bacterium]MDA1069976.1 hypothetical protein [Pseudomonadota bacterium]
MLEIDRRGLPAVAVFSEEFRSGVEAWRAVHGFDAAAVFVRHPIQPLTDEEVHGRADEVFEEVMAAITG